MLQVKWQSRGIKDFLLDLCLLSSGSTFQPGLVSLQFPSQTSPCFPEHNNLPATWKCYCFWQRWSSSWAESPVSQTHGGWWLCEIGMDWSLGITSTEVYTGDFKILSSNSNMRWKMVLQWKTFHSQIIFSGFLLAIAEKVKFSMKMAETIKCMEGKKHSVQIPWDTVCIYLSV